MVGFWPGFLMTRASRARHAAVLLALAIALVVVACGSAPFTLTASGPWAYSTVVEPPFERLAILVTITNRSGDDLVVNPADFVARDADHRIYPANPAEAVSDASAVRLAFASQRGVQAIVPLPTMTLRQDDVLSGFVVFDLPAGVRPVELIWRQTDTDTAVPLSVGR
ncbi:MAG TPA: hypothetical protein VFZ25_19250 [Chloroflexota bacterium]|nr:hypothetical protein [Chloroflexota bacterium]